MEIIRSVPENGATSISPNINLSISLSKNLDQSTVNAGTVLLTNLDTQEVLRSEISSNKNTVSILPSMMMDEYTSYRVDIIGSDADSPGGNISFADSTDLENTLSISFQTGEYSSSTSIITSSSVETSSDSDTSGSSPYVPTTDVDEDGVSDSYQAVEDASNDMTYGYENDLYLIQASPADGASDIFPDDVHGDNTIMLRFSRELDESSVSDALSITQHPIGGLRFAGTSEQDIANRAESTSNDLFCVSNRREYTHPTYTVDVSNEYIHISLDNDPVRLNSEINVDISKLLKSTEGASGNHVFLKNKVDIDFTTVFFPLYADVEEIRLELAELNITATDEIISRMILVNSIGSWNISCKGFELCNPPEAAIAYARDKTVLDIFDMSQTKGILNPGISKSLGDFSISYKGNARYRTPKEKELEDSIKSEISWLKRTYCNKKSNTWAIKGRTSPLTQESFRTRTWRRKGLYCPNRANTKTERRNKLPGSNDYWS